MQHVVLSLLHEEQAKLSYYLRYVYCLQFDEVDLCTYNRLYITRMYILHGMIPFLIYGHMYIYIYIYISLLYICYRKLVIFRVENSYYFVQF